MVNKFLAIDISGECGLNRFLWADGKNVKLAPMPFELFKTVLEKIIAAHDTDGLAVNLAIWSDPFSHTDLGKFTEFLSKAGIQFYFSTHLSLNNADMVESVLLHGPKQISVCVPGYGQATYSQYCGGDIDLVKRNLVWIDDFLSSRSLRGNVSMKWYETPVNANETGSMKDFATVFGFPFFNHPAIVADLETLIVYHRDGVAEAAPMKVFLPERSSADDEKLNEQCLVSRDALILDAKGDAYLCNRLPHVPKYRIGSIFEQDTAELSARAIDHPFCRECKRFGCHVKIS